MTTTFRRRLDNYSLRWQARLDSEWADRVLPWAAALALFIVLALLSLARARSLDSPIDLAQYAQAGWLLTRGEAPTVTIAGLGNLWAQQAAFAFYPIALVGRLLPIIPTLLVAQSAVLAFAVVPIWKISRKLANLRVGATATLLFVYAVYPVMHNLNLDGFHPEVLAVPGLLAAAYFGLSGRWRWFALCCLIVMASRADLGLAVAGLGGLLIVEGHRRHGLLTLIFGVTWTLLAASFIQPAFGDGSFAHVAAFAEFGNTPASIAWGMVAHPLDVLGRLFSEQNFNLLVTLLAPVVFLPVLAPRYLLPVVPLQFLYLVADVPSQAVFGQQSVAATAFVFLATAFALSRIGRMGVEKVTVDRRVLGALLLAGSVFFIRDAASSPYREPWAWGSQDAADGARLEARDRIPPDAGVRASDTMMQILAQRHELRTLDTSSRVDPAGAASGVDYVVLDQRRAEQWSAVERQIFREGLESSGFDLVLDRDGIWLFARRVPET